MLEIKWRLFLLKFYWIFGCIEYLEDIVFPLIFLCPPGGYVKRWWNRYETRQAGDISMKTHSGDAQAAYSKTVRLFDAIDTIILKFVIEFELRYL